MASENYMYENADSVTLSNIENSMYNLSHYALDVGGKLPLSMARLATRRCPLTQADTLKLEDLELTDIDIATLGELVFENKPSREFIKSHNAISTGDSNIVYFNSISPPKYPELLTALGSSYESAVLLSYVYLEIYSLYRACVDYVPTRLFKYSDVEIDTLVNNIYFIRTYIGSSGNSIESYETLDVLKQIHRDILYIKEYINSMSR